MTNNSLPLLHVFPSFGGGGAAVRFATLANHFASEYHHKIVALDGEFAARELLAPEVRYDFMPLHVDKRRTLPNLPVFRRIIRESGAELLVTYNWGAIEWALANLAGPIPHIHIEDGFGQEEADGQLRRRVWFRRLALLRTARVVVPSRTLFDIASRIWRIPLRRLTYIPNGIDCRRFASEPDHHLIDELGLPSDVPLIGAVGGLRPEKNFERLIRAFAATDPATACHLVIVGEGSERERLEHIVAELGLDRRVTLTGYLPKPERLLGTFDGFAVSSDTEQMPLGVLEAMAAGLPIAGVDVGDIRSMVAEENTPFIVARDELTGSMQALLDDPEAARRIGQANRQCARENFDHLKMIAAYRNLFELVASQS